MRDIPYTDWTLDLARHLEAIAPANDTAWWRKVTERLNHLRDSTADDLWLNIVNAYNLARARATGDTDALEDTRHYVTRASASAALRLLPRQYRRDPDAWAMLEGLIALGLGDVYTKYNGGCETWHIQVRREGGAWETPLSPAEWEITWRAWSAPQKVS